MKIIARLALLVCLGLLLSTIRVDSQQLPERIASHFDGQGVANGWMSRSSFTSSMVALGIGIPILVIGVIFSVRFFPSKFLNVPHPAYWRKPPNFQRACDFLFHSSLWFGCAFLLWQTAFFHLVVKANKISPPHLDNTAVLVLTFTLLAFTSGWVLVLLRYFLKTPPSHPEPA